MRGIQKDWVLGFGFLVVFLVCSSFERFNKKDKDNEGCPVSFPLHPLSSCWIDDLSSTHLAPIEQMGHQLGRRRRLVGSESATGASLAWIYSLHTHTRERGAAAAAAARSRRRRAQVPTIHSVPMSHTPKMHLDAHTLARS